MIGAPVRLPPGVKDRRQAVIAFGIASVLIGVACLLLGVLSVAMLGLLSTMAGATQQPGLPYGAGAPVTGNGTVAVTLAFYAGLGAVFIWLGIGSIKLRRWARALLSILSSVWLATGVLGLALAGLMLPSLLSTPLLGSEPLPGELRIVVGAITLAFLSVVFLVLPGVLTIFYGSRHVKATVEAYDPVARWTDACPPSILALCVLLGLGALSMLPLFVEYRPVVPLFGWLLSGFAGGIVLALVAASWVFSAWDLYRLRARGWWVLTVPTIALAASAVVTFAMVDPLLVLREMAIPADELAIFQAIPFFTRTAAVAVTVLMSAPFIGYLLYLKRQIRR